MEGISARLRARPSSTPSLSLHVLPAGAPAELAELRSPPHLRVLRPWSAPLLPPYISQRTPTGAPSDFDGSASCGPACMAMIARFIGFGRASTDYELILRFTAVGATTMEEGTEPHGISNIAAALGRRSHIQLGSDIEFMHRALGRRSVVVANGEYYAMSPHEDPTQREGHFVLVYGYAPNGDFLVHDSEDPSVRTVSPEGMITFLREHDRGGVQIEVELAPPMSVREKALLRAVR